MLSENWAKIPLAVSSLKTWSNPRFAATSMEDADQYLANLKRNTNNKFKELTV